MTLLLNWDKEASATALAGSHLAAPSASRKESETKDDEAPTDGTTTLGMFLYLLFDVRPRGDISLLVVHNISLPPVNLIGPYIEQFLRENSTFDVHLGDSPNGRCFAWFVAMGSGCWTLCRSSMQVNRASLAIESQWYSWYWIGRQWLCCLYRAALNINLWLNWRIHWCRFPQIRVSALCWHNASPATKNWPRFLFGRKKYQDGLVLQFEFTIGFTHWKGSRY